tara:strand:+ start:3212 stop:3580 length:369 start_codon:yes stop_codon:yes gene_type:complete
MPAPKKEELSNKIDQVLEKLEELSFEIGVLAELNKTPDAPTAPGVSQEVYMTLQHDYHELNRKYTALVADRVVAPVQKPPVPPVPKPPAPAPSAPVPKPLAPAPAPVRFRKLVTPTHILRNY